MSCTVTVVVPVHQDGDALRACLASLARLEPAPLESVLVVDGGDDDVRRLAEASGAHVLSLARNGGPARARNAGAAVARGDVLLFLDSDVSAPADLIGRVAAMFAREPELAAVIGSYDDAPAELGLVTQFRNLLHHYVHQTSRGSASTFWGACGAIKRDVFLDAGGFDEAFRQPAVEDIELGSRLGRLGHSVRLRKDLQVKHHKRWTLGSMLFTDLFRRALPWSDLILARGEMPNDLNVDRASRASVACVALLPALGVASLWVPTALAIAGVLAVAFLSLNLGFYRFLARIRGAGFAVGAVPLHAAHYACCGAGFAIAVARHALIRRTDSRSKLLFEDAGRAE